jgi:hypothetical protein
MKPMLLIAMLGSLAAQPENPAHSQHGPSAVGWRAKQTVQKRTIRQKPDSKKTAKS